MNLRFIEAFVWVARLRSFTAAAEKLHATQAAISARIATLETDFGVKLFERDKRTVTLTNSGEELLKYAEELLGMSARMREAVSDRAAYGGFIALGVIEPVVLTWLPELLEALRRQFPKVRVEIHSYPTTHLHDELLRGNLALALTAEAIANPAIENSSICGFQMGWIIAPTARGDPPLSDVELLDRLPILTFMRNSLVYRDVVAKLGTYCVGRINPMSSNSPALALVKAGYGLATLPLATIASELQSGALIGLRAGPELAVLPLIASRRRTSESSLVEAAVQLAIKAARVYASAARPGFVVVDGDHI
jgi:DNA-binding transcriptional LysR family regulator